MDFISLAEKKKEKTVCWGLALKCYELRTRQHKMLNINALRPSKYYLRKDQMSFGRRSQTQYYEGFTFVIKLMELIQSKVKHETLEINTLKITSFTYLII
jgi:hypothetical protein